MGYVYIYILYILITHFNGISRGFSQMFAIKAWDQWRLGVFSGAFTRLGQKEAAEVAWNT